jgi:glycosyltransferase involved in cell wall biosynthesis
LGRFAVNKRTQLPKRLRILAILNGSVRGYSGGDLHTVAILNEWANVHDVELFLPHGSSAEVIDLLGRNVWTCQSSIGQHSRIPSRLEYLIWVIWRTICATWYVIKRRGQWDVVVSSSHYGFDVLPLFMAGRCLARGVYWWHHATAPHGRPAWTDAVVRASEAVLVRYLRSGAACVLTGNSHSREWLKAQGIPPRAIALTSNGPSLQSLNGAEDEVLRDAPFLQRVVNERFILFCARLSNLKGAADLPSIVHDVVETSGKVRFLVCGPDGPEARATYQALENFERNGSVTFLGFVSESIKAWLFQHAHVLIAPSYEEGWGGSVADGVASGCWVVAYDLPALRESSPNGPIFVPLGDAASFARAVNACLDKPRASQPSASQVESWRNIACLDLENILAGTLRSHGARDG